MELTVIADSVDLIDAFKKIEKVLAYKYRNITNMPYIHFCIEGDSLCIITSNYVTLTYIKVKVRTLEDVKFNIDIDEFRRWFRTFDKNVKDAVQIKIAENVVSFIFQDTNLIFSNHKYSFWDDKKYSEYLRKGLVDYIKQEFTTKDLLLKKDQHLYLSIKDNKINIRVGIKDETFRVDEYFYDGSVIRNLLSILKPYNIKMYLCNYCCMLRSGNVWVVITNKMKP